MKWTPSAVKLLGEQSKGGMINILSGQLRKEFEKLAAMVGNWL
jgi:hypothetical protein